MSFVPRLVTMLSCTPGVIDARIRAARGDLHLFERVEVEVQRRRACGAHVGDVHTVDVPGVVGRFAAPLAM